MPRRRSLPGSTNSAESCGYKGSPGPTCSSPFRVGLPACHLDAADQVRLRHFRVRRAVISDGIARVSEGRGWAFFLHPCDFLPSSILPPLSQKLRHSAVGRRVLHFQKTVRPIRVRAHITQTDRQHQNTCQVVYSRDYSSHACLTPVHLCGVAEGFLIFILSAVIRKIFLVDVHSSSASSANYTQPTSTKEAIVDRTMGTTT